MKIPTKLIVVFLSILILSINIIQGQVPLPQIDTAFASKIDTYSAELNGAIITYGQPTTAFFKLKEGEVITQSPKQEISQERGRVKLKPYPLADLTPNTEYSFAIEAYTEFGKSVSKWVNFKTAKPKRRDLLKRPSIHSVNAIEITTNSAKYTAVVNSKGYTTTVTFETTPLNKIPPKVIDEDSLVLPISFTNLKPGTAYSFRISAENKFGVTTSDWIKFTTKNNSPNPSKFEKVYAENITTTTATLHGSIFADATKATAWFEVKYSESNIRSFGQKSLSTNSFTTLNHTVVGLTPSTEYEYRIVLQNAPDPVASKWFRFTTKEMGRPPTINGPSVSNITSSSATLNGSVNPNGASTTVSYESLTESGLQKHTIGAGTNPITIQPHTLTNLISDLEYQYRIRAFNKYGVTTSKWKYFDTLKDSIPNLQVFIFKGQIIDSSTNSPIVGAEIKLLQRQTESVYTSSKSGTDGVFLTEDENPYDLDATSSNLIKVEIAAMGYDTIIIQQVTTTVVKGPIADTTIIDLGIILLTKSVPVNYSVEGIILDEETNQPVADAEVNLLLRDNAILASATSGTDGRFFIPIDNGIRNDLTEASSLKLEISKKGYHLLSTPIKADTPKMDLGNIPIRKKSSLPKALWLLTLIPLAYIINLVKGLFIASNQIPKSTAQVKDIKKSNPADGTKENVVGEEAAVGIVLQDKKEDRFLQFRIKDRDQGYIDKFLLPNTVYPLKARIGFPEKDYHQAQTAVDTDAVFNTTSEDSVNLTLVFRSESNPGEAIGKEITLPRFGNSTEVQFELNSGTDPFFIGELEAYYNNKLLQRIRFIINVREQTSPADDDGIKVYLLVRERTDFTNLPSAPMGGTSLTYRDGDGKDPSISGMVDQKPLTMYFSPGLDKLMEDIKSKIQESILDENPETAPDEELSDLLRYLAIKGNTLFVQHLKERKLNGPLQIITNRPGFVPLDFVYEDAPPSKTATLCANGKAALLEGKCKGCFDKTESPAKHICPFGFWGLSHVIERTALEQENGTPGDYEIRAEPKKDRITLEILNSTLFATSDRADNVEVDITEKVADSIIEHSRTCKEVESWEEWRKYTKDQNPDSMILIVHVETDPEYNEEQVEIGNGDFLLQNYLDTSTIKPEKAVRSPLMIVIGCKTSNLDHQGFDISSKLIQEGAAIVLSNFTVISGRKAGPLVISLVEFLQEHGQSDVALGEILLKLRRHLMSEGNITGFSLVAYGDADWKLKAWRN